MAGLLTFGAGREAGGVVHNRELEILDFFPLHEIIQSQKTVTSMLVNNRSRVDERSILRNGQVCMN